MMMLARKLMILSISRYGVHQVTVYLRREFRTYGRSCRMNLPFIRVPIYDCLRDFIYYAMRPEEKVFLQ